MTVAILLWLLCAIEGFRLGIFIGQALDDAERWVEQYLDGASEVFWMPELWR